MKKAIWFLAALAILGMTAHAAKVDSTMFVYLEDAAGTILWSGDKLTIVQGGELEVRSGATLDLAAGSISRATLTEDALKKYKIPYSVILDSTMNPLSNAGGASTLKYGAVGTGVAGVTGETVDNATEATTSYIMVGLPAEYVAAGDVQVVIVCKITNAATAATVDFTAKEVSLTGGTLGSDICATAAQTITTSFLAKTFNITATDLVAGDLLQLQMDTSITDAAGGSTIEIQITEIYLLADVKG